MGQSSKIKFIGLLFSEMMMEANMAHRKTMTRRMRGLDKINEDPDKWDLQYPLMVDDNGVLVAHFKKKDDHTIDEYIKCPYGQPGDIIYAKETFYAYGYWIVVDGKWSFVDRTIEHGNYRYFDNPPTVIQPHRQEGPECGIGWYKRPSIFMPFKAARFMRQIKEIRLERLHDITPEDAIAEGVETWTIEKPDKQTRYYLYNVYNRLWTTNPLDSFNSLWSKINGQKSLESNPWVWVNRWGNIPDTSKECE